MKTYRAFLSTLLSLGFLAVFAGAEPDYDRSKLLNLEKGKLAVQGYDPVAYFSGTPMEGKTSLTHEYKGITYRFANEANREAFIAMPDHYEPQYGGWCAYAMLDSDKVAINPKRFKVVDEKLYLFYDGLWGDTLKRWNKLTNKQTETSLVEKANQNWTKIVSKK